MARRVVGEAIRPETQLPSLLKEMTKLQTSISELTREYDGLKAEAFPLVEAAGDRYEVDGIVAQIIRSQTWEVDAVRLLNKFGEKVYSLLTVSASKFRKAFESGLLGTPTEIKGIAKLIDETPRFRLSQK